MFNEVIKTIKWGSGNLELSTGKIARQADGAVVVKMGSSVVLCTTTCAKNIKEDVDFFPLTVHYREMAFAAGKIPGGFVKRETKASDREVLVSRLIDRIIRPLCHPLFVNETQIICTVLSYDPMYNTDILAIIGASASLSLSGIPCKNLVAASRVGMINGEFVLNPSVQDIKDSKLDLVIAGTNTSVMMVESEAGMLHQQQMLDAIKFGHEQCQSIIEIINDLTHTVNTQNNCIKKDYLLPELFPQSLKDKISEMKAIDIKNAFDAKTKQDRTDALSKIELEVLEYFVDADEESQFTVQQVKKAFNLVKSDIIRGGIFEKKLRIDNRTPTDIRQIENETSFLPRVHGSALFTRGETQALVTATLGTENDGQVVDSLEEEYKETFMLNYIFPPYSVGETTPVRAPGRREVGHGKLAWRALNGVFPSKQQFPYSVRIVSEITESNGSSSMATVCGASMALMDAGVPIKEPISGIAMGLIKKEDEYVILSDIIADEDYIGDMDLKVAGGRDGITALQMDIKTDGGITFDIMRDALQQASEGLIHILDKMSKAIDKTNVISEFAPSIFTFQIHKDKIRDVIGSGGKVIKELCEANGVKIDIDDTGTVSVAGPNKQGVDKAVKQIQDITFVPIVGDIFNAKVVKLLESGMFINYYSTKEGFVHISEVAHKHVESIAALYNEGDSVKVKVIGFDNKDRVRFTIKDVDNPIITQQRTTFNKNTKNKQNSPRKNFSNKENFNKSERKYFN